MTSKQLATTDAQTRNFRFEVKERSDKLMNYFLIGYFLVGLLLASFYGTWLIAIGVGGLLLVAYYSVKLMLPSSSLYQYVLSIALGLFMAQFIYQMHGMFEMHFFAFIGSVVLVTYQKWVLQVPLLVVIMLHHGIFNHLQNSGFTHIYFIRLNYFDLQIFTIHILLTAVICFICGLWAYQLKKYNEINICQTVQMAELQKEAQLSAERRHNTEERKIILESIGDAFFAVDKNWTVTYWNNMAEKILRKSRNEIIGKNLWAAYPKSINSTSYLKYHDALETNQAVHFEDFYTPLGVWFEISAYPSANGLSVYFIDITERKTAQIRLTESEKKYSELFHLSPLPMWVYDLDTFQFLDVNSAAIKNYGYSREEFLSMTIKDIRPPEDISKMKEALVQSITTQNLAQQGIFTHKKKNGETIQADIQSNFIQYKGKQAKVIIANDITERLRYINAIEQQNEKLIEISWMQSHVIRPPLARIMALIPMINNLEDYGDEGQKILEYLLISAKELDEVIKNISDKTSVIDDETLNKNG